MAVTYSFCDSPEVGMKVSALLLLLVVLSQGRVIQDQPLTDHANAIQERILLATCMEEGKECLPDANSYWERNSCLGCCSCLFWQEPCYGEKDSKGYAKCLKQDYQILQ